MRTVTVADLGITIRNRADMNDTSFVSNVELTSYIQASATELYDILVQKWGDEYFLKSVSLTLLANTTSVNLPTDFLKLKGVDLVNGNQKIALSRFQFGQRNEKNCLKYRIMGNQLTFTDPNVSGDKTLILWYVPTAENEGIIDGVNGWEEYIVIDVMIKILGKEQSEDVPALMNQKLFQLKRIEDAASNRDAAEPERVMSVRNRYVGNRYRGDDDDGFQS